MNTMPTSRTPSAIEKSGLGENTGSSEGTARDAEEGPASADPEAKGRCVPAEARSSVKLVCEVG